MTPEEKVREGLIKAGIVIPAGTPQAKLAADARLLDWTHKLKARLMKKGILLPGGR